MKIKKTKTCMVLIVLSILIIVNLYAKNQNMCLAKSSAFHNKSKNEAIVEFITELFRSDSFSTRQRIKMINHFLHKKSPFMWGLLRRLALIEKSNKVQAVINASFIHIMERNFRKLKVFNKSKVVNIRSNFDLRDGNYKTRKVPGSINVIPSLYSYEVKASLSGIIDSIVSVLPNKELFYRVSPDTYHISLAILQETVGVNLEDTKLTEEERLKLIDLIGILAAKYLPFKLRFKGIRLGDDGGIIAVWEDSGQIELFRREYFELALEITEKVNYARPKPFLYTTIGRILDEFITEQDLLVLKAKVEEINRELSKVPAQNVNSIRVIYETKWMLEEYNVICEFFVSKNKIELAVKNIAEQLFSSLLPNYLIESFKVHLTDTVSNIDMLKIIPNLRLYIRGTCIAS